MMEINQDLLLNLDLQFFSSDDVGGIDDIVGAFEQDFMQEQEQEAETLEVAEAEDGLEAGGEGESSEDAGAEQPDLTSDDKRDEAFANLRRERDSLAQQMKFLSDFAAANGMTVEQLQENYEQSKLEKEAESKGVSPDILKRMTELEKQNMQLQEQTQTERFNASVNATLAKYSGNEDNFKQTIKYANEHGLIDGLRSGALTFEAAYKLAHMDVMIEEAKRNAVQEDLAKRKQRQQDATHVPSGQSLPTGSEELDEIVAADAKEILEMWS